FGLSEPSNEQKSNNKIYGVLPYITPENLNGEQYTLSSDIYSFGVVMAELLSGKPPFYKRNHDNSLALKISNELEEILDCWYDYKDNEKYGYKGEEPINSSFITTTYLNEDNEDSQLIDLEIPNTSEFEGEYNPLIYL
ncbi:hypothetical protein C1646_728178, partial [Rhizophagus diaphanus]